MHCGGGLVSAILVFRSGLEACLGPGDIEGARTAAILCARTLVRSANRWRVPAHATSSTNSSRVAAAFVSMAMRVASSCAVCSVGGLFASAYLSAPSLEAQVAVGEQQRGGCVLAPSPRSTASSASRTRLLRASRYA